MLQPRELSRIQRALDGFSSDSEPPSPCDIFKEAAEPTEAPSEGHSSRGTEAEPAAAKGAAAADVAATDSSKASSAAVDAAGDVDEDDEDFSIHALLREGRRQRRRPAQQQQQQQQQQQNEKCPKASFPPVELALQEAEERVSQKRKQQEAEQAARAARLAGDEIQHVPAAAPAGGPRRTPPKKQQQVYVGLPVGVGWHVPLVGIEGRGGYKPSAEEQTAENEKRSKETEARKKALTIKEREKLKRKKGQSSHATWKPETWMQLRQQYD
ncbi:hypothetical protein, conserved [Eimeria necatrix]|uniref:Uncharacterized protein n=1 Tax=Eimeria necatrix TaxID=51315 RepID=U6MGC0_9EIME|nr:hypothetical protein, conserved [Eimeria necatrix]CDJ63056.1 hypothetical protein, conserved [Eimeria necatrix]